MIVGGKLDVFENFVVGDRKIKKERIVSENNMFLTELSTVSVDGKELYSNRSTFFGRVVDRLRFMFKKKAFDPIDYFDKVKSSMRKLDGSESDVIRKYIILLKESAFQLQQTVFIEMLDREKIRIDNEAILSINGFKYAISEEEVVKLSLNATDIHLTWIKNFIRYIPEDVLQKYIKADALDVFENYVVMHYGDPSAGVAETEEEIARRKDPILFGVFKESKKLYYIADWVDDTCDLTLDKLLAVMDRKLSNVELPYIGILPDS